jgi:hypothetical protein
MKRALRACGIAVAATTAMAGLAVANARAATTPGWRIVHTDSSAMQFTSASASGAGNAWAAGEGPYGGLVINHWTGTAWQAVAPPSGLPSGIVQRAAVAATTGQSAWVFDSSRISSSSVDGPVTAMEWSGKWIAKKTFPGNASLVTAAASGPKDVWAFGAVDTGISPGKQTPWAYHLSGSTWFKATMPIVVSTASANPRAGDWVIGQVEPQPKSGPAVKVLHWTSSGWKSVPLPAIPVPNGQRIFPGGIAAISPTSVWAGVVVGAGAGPGPATVMLMHWNGASWARITLPQGASVGNLVGDGNGGLWIVGNPIRHYSAGKWTTTALPGTNILVFAVTSIPGTRSILGAGMRGTTGIVLKYGP